jgi:hypothetical protein
MKALKPKIFPQAETFIDHGVTLGGSRVQSAMAGTADRLKGLFTHRFSDWIKRKNNPGVETDPDNMMPATKTWEAEGYEFEDPVDKMAGSLMSRGTTAKEFGGDSGFPSKRFFDGSDRSSVWNEFGEYQLGSGVGMVREASGFGVTVDTGRYLSENQNVFVRKDLMSSKSVASQRSIGAKFKIVCIEDLMTSSNDDICLGLIGYGPTICSRSNCQKNHLGGKSDIKINNICVVKSNEVSVFSEPTLLQDQVETILFREWLQVAREGNIRRVDGML